VRVRLPLLLVASSICWLACSAHPRAGTGDVAFRLTWRGISDLDLMVVDPDDNCIFFGNRQPASGGILDVDCNAGAVPCERPIENVFWPSTSAPAGTYRVWVHAHSLLPAEAPLAYELQVLRGERAIFEHAGTFREHDEVQGPFRHAYPGDGDTGLAAPEPLPESCSTRRFFRPEP
jgi:hypothetical protein